MRHPPKRCRARVACEKHRSAHRTPDTVVPLAKAQGRGFQIIIAGAGGRAAPAGHDRVADGTSVFGLRSNPRLGRVDSLYPSIQMPQSAFFFRSERLPMWHIVLFGCFLCILLIGSFCLHFWLPF